MKLTQRDRSFLALGLLSALIFAALNWGVLPWTERFMDSGQQLTLAEKKLRQRKELVAAAPQAQAQLKQAEAQLAEQEKHLLPKSDAEQAGPQLQQWLVARAAEQKLEVGRTDFLAATPVGNDYLRVPVRLDFNAPITQVVQFLNAVTHGERVVSVDELQINSYGTEKDKKVHCGVVISALMSKGA